MENGPMSSSKSSQSHDYQPRLRAAASEQGRHMGINGIPQSGSKPWRPSTRLSGSSEKGPPMMKETHYRRSATPPDGGASAGCISFFGNPWCGVQYDEVDDFNSKSAASVDDVHKIMEKLKHELLGQLQHEMKEITHLVTKTNKDVMASMDKLGKEVRSMRSQLEVERAPKSGFSRLVSCLTTPICGAEAKSTRSNRSQRSSTKSSFDEPEPQAVPHSMMPDGSVKSNLSGSEANRASISLSIPPPPKPCLLSPIVQHFSAASKTLAEANEVEREPFIEGLSEYSKLLDRMGDMGCYLESNVKKLRGSKADQAKSGYRDWLLSELPVHKATSYKEYLDDSAWMANLWIGWTLEFFVELFAELHAGKDTKAAADAAYSRTLYNHHNFFQRTAFNTAVKRLPPRDSIFQSLAGSASKEDLVQEIGQFVSLARPLAAFCNSSNEILDKRLQAERKAFSGR